MITISIIFSLSFTAVAINIPKESIKESLIKKSKLNKVSLIEIPKGKSFSSIEIISHKYESEVSKKPEMIFYPTSYEGEIEISERIYTEPLTYDILNKGKKTYVRIFAPEVYYKNNKKYKTESIDYQIIYNDEPKFIFQEDKYNPQINYQYVIITNESFYPIFKNYFKNWKILNDDKISNILIINVSDIISNSTYWVNNSYGDANSSNSWLLGETPISVNYSLFNDSQAKIRNFLRYAYNNYNTRYCLLGGNKDVIPVRMVASYAVGNCGSCTGWENDTSHASDMYYACLHYSMNNNTNTRFMENDCCGSPYDQIDWGYDLCVGRVLVGTIEHLYNWINKTKAYVNGLTQGNYLRNHIVAAKNNGGSITNESWLNLGGSFSADLNDEFPANFTFLNNQNITQVQWSIFDDYVNGEVSPYDGFHMILHQGHGGTLYSDYYPGENTNELTPNFLYTEGCTSGDYGTGTDSRMEKWMRQNDSTFASIANSAYGWFGGSTYYLEEMMSQMFNETTGNFTRIFCKAHNDAREIIGHDPDCIWGMVVKETNFAGDPALEYQWYENTTTQFISIGYQTSNIYVDSNNLIFNWSVVYASVQYNLQIANDSDFTDVVINITNINEYEYSTYYDQNITRVSFEIPPSYSLPAFKEYYCRVRALYK